MTTSAKQQTAQQHFSGEMNCAQSVLLAYQDQLKIEHESLVKIGAAFGAGMGEGEVCGAVSASLMVIGLINNKSHSPVEMKEQVKVLSEKFKNEFNQEYGSLKCKHLIGVDLKYAENYEMAMERNVFHTHCPGFIDKSIQIIDDLFENVH